ncbi:MAG: DUF5996 family protein [Ignavibacteriaceae bacterium]|nr:DUF5996 family protein [Ignavibacteriaceae bacterium]
MLPLTFPPLALADWKESRNTLHKYCQLVGAIREVMSKPLPNALHTNLLLSKKGFTTSPILKDDSSTDKLFEVILDVQHRRLRIESNYREPLIIALTGQSLNALCDETCSLLTDIGITPPLERPSFLEGTRGQFDSKPVKAYWKAVSSTKRVLKKIKAELKGETSPIQLHVDVLTLSLTWYCKDVPDISLLEQLEFGFSTGDEKFPDAHFFISSFPDTRALKKILPNENRYQFTQDESEIILPYSEVFKAKNSEKTLLDFYRSVQK